MDLDEVDGVDSAEKRGGSTRGVERSWVGGGGFSPAVLSRARRKVGFELTCLAGDRWGGGTSRSHDTQNYTTQESCSGPRPKRPCLVPPQGVRPRIVGIC